MYLSGIITKEDLIKSRKTSQATKREPIVYTMRNGWKIIGPPPPASTVVVDFMINIIESLYPKHPQRKILKNKKKTLDMLHR